MSIPNKSNESTRRGANFFANTKFSQFHISAPRLHQKCHCEPLFACHSGTSTGVQDDVRLDVARFHLKHAHTHIFIGSLFELIYGRMTQACVASLPSAAIFHLYLHCNNTYCLSAQFRRRRCHSARHLNISANIIDHMETTNMATHATQCGTSRVRRCTVK